MGRNSRPRKTKSEHDRAVAKRNAEIEATRRDAEVMRQQAQQIRQFSMQWQGQLPHPTDLEAYERLVPGSAQQLIDRVIAQSEHRAHIERRIVDSNIERSRRGQVLGFILSVIGMGVGGYAISRGYAWQGTAGVFGDLALLAGVFVYGNRSRRDQLTQRWQEATGSPPPTNGDPQGRLF